MHFLLSCSSQNGSKVLKDFVLWPGMNNPNNALNYFIEDNVEDIFTSFKLKEDVIKHAVEV